MIAGITELVTTRCPWCEKTKGWDEYQTAICQEITGKTVALTYTSNDADACLIVAAPELLEALKGLTGALSLPCTTKERIAFEAACKAIAKAEGGN